MAPPVGRCERGGPQVKGALHVATSPPPLLMCLLRDMTGPFSVGVLELFDNLDYASRARVHNDRMIVHISVAVCRSMILRGHFIVSHTTFRQYRTNPEVIAVTIRGSPLTDNVFPEARAILDAKNTPDCSGRRTNRASDYRAKRAGRSPALLGTLFCSTNGALCLGNRRHHESNEKSTR
jgi:hypothetical protein